ncbi:hypothetical protein CAPTEDRAFT_197801 [Capitella teleta]|uniref:Sulfotransferase domain-containing protein n=1 Tax=Capitella teleta TaxID=283909 RepID=R7TRA5_CAPTE|nr:hypothetical protein CAPTEDRAFT_197801 [Capitella teleta]|eukprot:ELT94026.1 hypothetical protein CAPTEDRAFT_197801 [Capitella teleta]
MFAHLLAVFIVSPSFLMYAFVCYVWSNIQRIIVKTLTRLCSLSGLNEPVKVYRVIYKRKFVGLDIASPHNFLCLFWGSRSIFTMLNSNVTPYCFHGYHVYFVETESELDLGDKQGLYQTQWKQAKKLLVVSMKDYFKFVQGLPQPDVRVVFLTSTGRCGESQLTALLQNIRSVKSISEPDIFTTLARPSDQRELRPQTIGLLHAASFKLLSHFVAQKSPCRTLVIRGRPVCLDSVPLMFQYAPWVKHLFMYGQGSRTVRSLRAVFQNAPSLQNQVIEVTVNGDRVTDIDSLVCMTWARIAARFTELRRKKIPIYSIRHEDMVADPALCLQSIINTYELKIDASEKQSLFHGLEAARSHKQNGMMMSAESRLLCEAICQRMAVPSLFGNEPLPGAIFSTREPINTATADETKTPIRSTREVCQPDYKTRETFDFEEEHDELRRKTRRTTRTKFQTYCEVINPSLTKHPMYCNHDVLERNRIATTRRKQHALKDCTLNAEAIRSSRCPDFTLPNFFATNPPDLMTATCYLLIKDFI